MKNMDFVKKLAHLPCFTSQMQAASAIEAVFLTIGDCLRAGETVNIQGFGKFAAVGRKARDARNPITGEKMHIAAKRVPHFKASSLLRAKVNG